jgi:hypothetical protein
MGSAFDLLIGRDGSRTSDSREILIINIRNGNSFHAEAEQAVDYLAIKAEADPARLAEPANGACLGRLWDRLVS